MTNLVRRFEPLGELARLQRQVDSLFGEMFGGNSPARVGWTPSVDVEKTADSMVYTLDLPGLRAEDVNIEAQNGVLLISGERTYEQEEKHEGYFVRERSHGTFARSFSLPQGVRTDDITAQFEDGVLKVTVPLPEETKPKRIEVRTGAGATNELTQTTS